MTIRHTFAALAVGAAAVLAACSESDREQSPAEGLAAITLTLADDGADGGGTRTAENGGGAMDAATTRGAAGGSVSGLAAGNVRLRFSGGTVVTADGTEMLTTLNTASATSVSGLYMAHGATAATVDAYAPSGYATVGGTGAWSANDAQSPASTTTWAMSATPSVATWTVAADQTTDAGYQGSDLMFGTTILKRTLGQTAAATGTITMQHRMARLQVTATTATTGYAVAAMRIVSGWRTVRLENPHTATPAALVTVADHSDLSNEITPQAAVSMLTGGSDVTATGYCLLPPQELSVSEAFLEVDLSGGGTTVTTRYTLQQPLTLAGGHAYRFNVTADPAVLSATISPFDPDAAGTTTARAYPLTFQAGTAAFRMLSVEGGPYSMQTRQGWGDEYKNKYSTLTGELDDYYLSETLVTEQLYNAVMNTDDLHGSATEQYPKNGLSYNAWLQFIDKLNQLTAAQRPEGWHFCMPTDAQWQYAAQGGRHSHGFAYAGSDNLNDVGWWYYSSDASCNSAEDEWHQVAQLAPNELGLYDMSGLLWEPCQDAFDGGGSTPLTSGGTLTNWIYIPSGIASSGFVVRGGGGSFHSGGVYASGYEKLFYEVNARNKIGDKTTAANYMGLRLCLRRMQVGDLLFSDGTWGNRAEYPSKTPVAVVIATETSAADQARGYRQGYALSLKEDSYSGGWTSNSGYQTAQVTDRLVDNSDADTQWAAVTGDMDGLTHCLWAKQKNSGTYTNLEAMATADNYNTTQPVSGSNSGWYLPSIGQLYAAMRTMSRVWDATGAYLYPYWTDVFDSSYTKAWSMRDATHDFSLAHGTPDYCAAAQNTTTGILAAMNRYMQERGLVSGTHYTAFALGHMQMSSTEQSAQKAFELWTSSTGGDTAFFGLNGNTFKNNSSTRHIRPVIAF